MDYQALFNELHLFEQLLALLVGMPRLFMLVQVAPFMGGNILTGQLRTTVVFACYLILHPAIVASLPETQGLSPSTFALYGAILVKETLIGMLLGYLSGMLFWTIQCAGFFIDNQRGLAWFTPLTKSGRSRSSSRSACLRTSTCRCSSPGA